MANVPLWHVWLWQKVKSIYFSLFAHNDCKNDFLLGLKKMCTDSGIFLRSNLWHLIIQTAVSQLLISSLPVTETGYRTGILAVKNSKCLSQEIFIFCIHARTISLILKYSLKINIMFLKSGTNSLFWPKETNFGPRFTN